MKKSIVLMLSIVFLSGLAIAQEKMECSVASLPPVVVKTVPAAGETEVDPNLKEISVTFSKDMAKGFSWVQTADAETPKLASDPIFVDDNRTCIAQVNLEPGKTYVIWLNTEKFNNFKDKEGNAAIPYLLVFQTKK